MLGTRAGLLGLPFAPPHWQGRDVSTVPVTVLPLTVARPVVAGRLDSANAPYVIKILERAIDGCLAGEFDALVTAPVHKGILNDAGTPFTGHTEFLAERTGANKVVMMLTDGELRVALATTHCALSAVSSQITQRHLCDVLRVLHAGLEQRFAIR
ncbi:MAG: 4-hydroxythreonine-4-phosphate dehydrogenase PdxA, partial [Pseudomonas stutzeri]|nr:4-hydroxythreonine-4-phosphate dehydrogenase PdxA [Stutzerimonas stutzeri]